MDKREIAGQEFSLIHTTVNDRQTMIQVHLYFAHVHGKELDSHNTVHSFVSYLTSNSYQYLNFDITHVF